MINGSLLGIATILFLYGPAFAAGPDISPAIPPQQVEAAASLVVPSLHSDVLSQALKAHRNAKAKGHTKSELVTVIDYSKPSTEKRLWVIDLTKKKVLFHELVAHGKGSGENHATKFGNTNASHLTSLGIFVTAETYDGKHGYSLKLDGLDKGVNDRARDRAIVFHGADYATADFAKKYGRLGRSHGCPAVGPTVAKSLIDTIKDGTVVFAYHREDKTLATSEFLR